MTTPRPPMSPIQSLELAWRRIDRALHALPSVLDGLDERRARVANRERPNAEVLVQTSGHGDPTADLAVELASVANHRTHISNAAALVLRAIDHLDDVCRDALGRRRDDPDAPTCAWEGEGGKKCYDLPGVEVTSSGVVHTRSNRLCDRHEIERRRAERQEAEAARGRRSRAGGKAYS